jgi:hypothetical protein
VQGFVVQVVGFMQACSLASLAFVRLCMHGCWVFGSRPPGEVLADPSDGALSGRLKSTIRRHEFTNNFLS